MGVGTLAAYGLPGDYFRFYEINPDVIELSSGARPVFTFVRDSQAQVAVEQGDARLVLEREALQGNLQDFDVLVLDAFTGDAIPVHLLTLEAFETYWKHLNPEHGVIAIHITCNHVDLFPVIEGAAQHFKAHTLMRLVFGGFPYRDNEWAFIARDPRDLQVNGLAPTPPPFGYKKPSTWTDDYSNIVSLLH